MPPLRDGLLYSHCGTVDWLGGCRRVGWAASQQRCAPGQAGWKRDGAGRQGGKHAVGGMRVTAVTAVTACETAVAVTGRRASHGRRRGRRR